MYFLCLKNKTWSGAKTVIYYTREHCCSLKLTPSTLIPSLSCLPLPLRKFNPLPCHCYNNLRLLDTSLNMTVTQNWCHIHLGQAVLWQYIFIPCCCTDFQFLFSFVAAWGCSSWGRGAGCGTPSCCSFSRPEFLLFLPQSKSPHLCWWLQPPPVLWPRSHAKYGVLFKYVLFENFQCFLFSNPVRCLRAFSSQFQALHSFASFYLLLLILTRKPAFLQSIFLAKWLSCIFQYRFSCMVYHSWITHRASVSSCPSSAFSMKLCSISGSEKGQLG